jgi:hypothetical protein
MLANQLFKLTKEFRQTIRVAAFAPHTLLALQQ